MYAEKLTFLESSFFWAHVSLYKNVMFRNSKSKKISNDVCIYVEKIAALAKREQLLERRWKYITKQTRSPPRVSLPCNAWKICRPDLSRTVIYPIILCISCAVISTLAFHIERLFRSFLLSSCPLLLIKTKDKLHIEWKGRRPTAPLV